MKNNEKPFNPRLAGVVIFATFLISSIGGYTAGTMGKAARFMDDVHDVKQDYDKAKGKVVEDYEVVSDKAKESVKNVDAVELGESTTKGLKEVGGAVKKRLIDYIAGPEDRALQDLIKKVHDKK